MTQILRIFFLVFLFFFFALFTNQANAGSTCKFSDCFAVTCSPECNASTCGQTVFCLGYCPAEGVYCTTDQGKCDPCSKFKCTPTITSCPCGSQCGGFAACQDDCGHTISSSCPACAPFCGDRICNNGETCSSCSGDCGTCPALIPCPGSGIPSSGWGGSCSPGQTTKLACDGPHHCSVASCSFYTSNAAGNTYCWFNDSTCHNDPAACDSVNPCPTITCNGNSGAGGTCSYPSSPNVNIPGCTYTCPGSTKTVSGHTISVCQPNNCYDNDCTQCYPDDPNACKTGTTKTTEICDDKSKWVQQNQACVANTNCIAGIATPTPIPLPNCTTNPSCGSCKLACGQGNSRTCQYTQPQPCNPVPSFEDTSGCASNCPANFNCVSNSCQPSLFVSGNVYVDTNVNTIKDAGESNYTGTATFQLSNGTSVNAASGSYVFNDLLSGSYTVSYTNPPTGTGGYSITYPLNGPPPSLTVSVGSTGCNPGDAGSHGASCNANGSVIELNFGITNLYPWIQGIGASLRLDTGFTSKIPQGSQCGSYASLPGSGGTPGLVFTGSSTPDFGQGSASSKGWVVGGPTYPNLYAPTRQGGIIKTSYNYVLSRARQGNITPTDISSFCGGGGIGNCNLSFSSANHGVYIANGNLRLNSFTFPLNANFVILVNGDLTILGKIFVPNGSTALFTATGDIRVDRNVGEGSFTSTASSIEGIYSADRSFIVEGNNSCTTGADIRLNVAGSVIANAALSGGSFQPLRNLCGGNVCPAFSVKERPDFVLNTPEFLRQPNFTYQEIAP